MGGRKGVTSLQRPSIVLPLIRGGGAYRSDKRRYVNSAEVGSAEMSQKMTRWSLSVDLQLTSLGREVRAPRRHKTRVFV